MTVCWNERRGLGEGGEGGGGGHTMGGGGPATRRRGTIWGPQGVPPSRVYPDQASRICPDSSKNKGLSRPCIKNLSRLFKP